MTGAVSSAAGGTERRLLWSVLFSAILHGLILSLIGPIRVQGVPGAALTLQVRIVRDAKSHAEDVTLPPVERHAPGIALVAAGTPSKEATASLPVEQGPPPPWALPVHYYKSSELEQQPQPLTPVQPRYPENAAAHRQEGWVRLLLLIDEQGVVRSAEVVEANPPELFDGSALAAFREVRFEPGRRAGIAVKSRFLLRLDFTLQQELYPLGATPR